MKKLLNLIFLLISNNLICAQTKITGLVLNENKMPIANCNILILNDKDSSLITGTLTNTKGNFTTKIVLNTNYLLAFSSTGLKMQYQKIDLSNNNEVTTDIGTTILFKEEQQLANVTISAKKPFLEQKIDRLVVNIKSSITNAGSTVLDVLQKSPGVTVDRSSGTISMSGKDGVQVMINGKINYMPADALINMLNGMSSNNVQQIELITTPPAKYDAMGNAGYINIVLINSPDEGFNGIYSITSGAYNGYGPSANLDFNYRKKKINFFGSISSSDRKQPQTIDSYRKIWNGLKTTETNIFSYRNTNQFNNSIRFGLDFKLTANTTMGVLVSGYSNYWYMSANNLSELMVNQQKDTSIKIDNIEDNNWSNVITNFNLQHNCKNGDQINFNIDYLYYYNTNPTDYTNNYFDGKENFIKTTFLKSGKQTNIYIFPIQLDFSKKINNTTAIEYGAKTVLTKFTNNVLVANLQQSIWIPDNDYSANYLMKESIAALYTSFTYTHNKKNDFKGGLRYEFITNNLGTETLKNIIDKRYGKLFPTVYWKNKINDNNSITLSYNKRINRPSFNDLAPFLIFSDPNTFTSGNAALQPTIAHTVKLEYGFKRFIFSIIYSDESNPIGRFQSKVNTVNNKLYQIVQNLDYAKSISGLVVVPTNLTKWWMGSINISGTWKQVAASFLTTPIRAQHIYYNISGFQSFKINKSINAELSGFYMSKNLFGIAVGYPFGVLNIAVQKKFASSSLKFGIDDLFDSNKWHFVTDVSTENFYTDIKLHLPRRLCKITFSKTFGNKLLKGKRDRNTASDEERSRVQ